MAPLLLHSVCLQSQYHGDATKFYSLYLLEWWLILHLGPLELQLLGAGNSAEVILGSTLVEGTGQVLRTILLS
jgi:hypothetical protein